MATRSNPQTASPANHSARMAVQLAKMLFDRPPVEQPFSPKNEQVIEVFGGELRRLP